MAYHCDNSLVSQYMTDAFPSPYGLADAYRWCSMNLAAPVQYNYGICLPGPDAGEIAKSEIDGRDGRESDDGSDPKPPRINGPHSLIGGIGLKPGADVQSRTMEIGYWIGQAYWNKGFATEALREFTKWTWAAFPDCARLWAGVFELNEGSGKVLKKCGFVRESTQRCAIVKKGVVQDLIIWRMCRDEFEKLEEDDKARSGVSIKP
jgi:[ribosomal protein S5]-alanine N-acetyltransferase